ncbi:MAG: SHOCT domain-containing protein [Catenulispora sp.]
MPGQSAPEAAGKQGGEPQMMYYGGGHMTGWGWFGMSIGMIVFWGLLIVLAMLVYRAFTDNASGGRGDAGPARTDPRQILAERYARGEIDSDEYRDRLATLTGAGTGTPPRPVAHH